MAEQVYWTALDCIDVPNEVANKYVWHCLEMLF